MRLLSLSDAPLASGTVNLVQDFTKCFCGRQFVFIGCGVIFG